MGDAPYFREIAMPRRLAIPGAELRHHQLRASLARPSINSVTFPDALRICFLRCVVGGREL